MAEIRKDVNDSYENTLKKVMPEIPMQEEYNDHDYIDNSDGQTVEALDPKYDEKEGTESSPIKNTTSTEDIPEVISLSFHCEVSIKTQFTSHSAMTLDPRIANFSIALLL